MCCNSCAAFANATLISANVSSVFGLSQLSTGCAYRLSDMFLHVTLPFSARKYNFSLTIMISRCSCRWSPYNGSLAYTQDHILSPQSLLHLRLNMSHLGPALNVAHATAVEVTLYWQCWLLSFSPTNTFEVSHYLQLQMLFIPSMNMVSLAIKWS